VDRVIHQTEHERIRRWRETVWSSTVGEPFTLGDESGRVAVSARLVDTNSTWVRLFASDKIIEGGATERTTQQPGPHLSRLIAAGAVDPKRVRVAGDVMRVEITETLIPPGKHLFVVAKPRSWHGQVVLTSDDREYSAISSYPASAPSARGPSLVHAPTRRPAAAWPCSSSASSSPSPALRWHTSRSPREVPLAAGGCPNGSRLCCVDPRLPRST